MTNNRMNEPTAERWRKKPVEIEARRFSGAMELIDAEGLALWCGGTFKHDPGAGQEYKTYYWSIEIPTLEGTMRATPGDYIIKGVQGEFYPCRGDIFEQTYEPAALVAAQGAAPRAEAYDHCCQHPKCPGGSLCCCASEQRLRDCWNQWREEIAGDSRQAFRDGYQAGQNDPAPWLTAPVLPSSDVDEDALRNVVRVAKNDWLRRCGQPGHTEDIDVWITRAVAAWLKDGAL